MVYETRRFRYGIFARARGARPGPPADRAPSRGKQGRGACAREPRRRPFPGKEEGQCRLGGLAGSQLTAPLGLVVRRAQALGPRLAIAARNGAAALGRNRAGRHELGRTAAAPH
ncbi:uncharacterized protein STAUR_3384 [Stigmatella aurantiaca DW4/3-1]|nr:uncharacterized protein STAUR_3384 [Stigmatella aurantiaca DW4/3-1]